MNLKNFLWYTGIWTYPPLVALVSLIVQALELSIPVVWQYLVVWGLPLLYPIIITWTNIERQQRGQTDFSLVDKGMCVDWAFHRKDDNPHNPKFTIRLQNNGAISYNRRIQFLFTAHYR